MSVVAALLALLLGGTLVPRHAGFVPTPGGVEVYVLSNGFHTSLLVPLREPRTGTNWLAHVGDTTWRRRFGGYGYAAFGWGNEAFFLESYGGRFPRAGTVVRALLPGRSLMHVDFYRRAPQAGEQVAGLRVSEAQYRALAAYIAASFETDSAGHWRLRNAAGYTPED
ncbi:MAG TPA: DUF2459 domain-containing protein, partial [bacterium]|nr:DUF2459 domain-containing protein [bacterium]